MLVTTTHRNTGYVVPLTLLTGDLTPDNPYIARLHSNEVGVVIATWTKSVWNNEIFVLTECGQLGWQWCGYFSIIS